MIFNKETLEKLSRNAVNIKFKNGKAWNNVVILNKFAQGIDDREQISEILNGELPNYNSVIECVYGQRVVLFLNEIDTYSFSK